MLFHSSISVSNPENVANVLAKILGGGVVKAPDEMFRDCYVAFGLDERGTMIEVHPESFAFVPRLGEAPAAESSYDPARRAAHTPTHFALGSSLSQEEVFAIAQAQGWSHRFDLRQTPSGDYGVVEIFIENRMMIEVLTPPMQEQYVAFAERVRSRIPRV